MPSYTYEDPEDRQILPAGDYDFAIAEVFAFETSSKGSEYLPIKLRIKPEGMVYDNLLFTEKAKFRIDQLLKSIGRAPLPGTAVDFDDPTWLVGCRGRCRIKVEEYNGKKGNKVEAYVFTPGAVTGRKVTAAAPAPALRSVRGSAKSAPATAPAPSVEDEESGDVPF
ncbi:MAG: hypothetical protein ACAI35_26385 [Candidatus Methylacidiphilales bacterium]